MPSWTALHNSVCPPGNRRAVRGTWQFAELYWMPSTGPSVSPALPHASQDRHMELALIFFLFRRFAKSSAGVRDRAGGSDG